MVILGIDPGLASTGYGVVEKKEGLLRPLGFGGIDTSPREPLSSRLDKIYSEVRELIERYHPDLLVLEELFFNKNAKTAIAVAQARGALLLCAKKSEKPVFEYTPLQIKQAITGYGRADKNQMQRMIQILLNL